MLMRTRSRSRNTPCTFDCHFRNTPNGSKTLWYQFNSSFSQSETITDDKESKHSEKPCFHSYTIDNTGTQYRFFPLPNSYGWYDSNRPGYYCCENVFPSYLATNNIVNSIRVANIPDSIKQQAYISMLPKVNDGLSLINFILELKDLRKMFSSKTMNRRLSVRKSPSIGGADPGLMSTKVHIKLNKKGKLEARDISDDYLNYSFGWKPFVSDLLKIWTALTTLDRKVKYLKEHANRVLRRNAVIDLTSFTLPANESRVDDQRNVCGSLSPSGRFINIYTKRWYPYQPRYHATMIYSYTFPKGQTAFTRQIRAFLDILGLRFDPAVVWNAIPFSFVVDWVANVGSFLRSFTPTDLGMEVVILDYSQSVKFEQVTEVSATYQTGASIINDRTPREWIKDRTIGCYERVKGIPPVHSVTVGLPGMMQLSLGGALVLSGKTKDPRYGGRPSRMR